MVCKDLCDKVASTIRYYKDDVKRCNVCSRFIHLSSIFCPCCHSRLRTKPRDGRVRERFRRYIAV